MDKILNAIQDLLVDNKPTGVKDVIKGDPQKIPESSMPAITIMPVGTDYIKRGTQYDQKVHTVNLRLVYNAKDIVGKTYADPAKPVVHKIEESIAITETTNSDLETTNASIVGLLQQNHTLPNAGVPTCQTSHVVSIKYEDRNVRGFPTYEVLVTLQATVVANRIP